MAYKIKQIIKPTTILLPNVEDLSLYATIACDQYSNNKQYWDEQYYSTHSQTTLSYILPEAYLSCDNVGEMCRKVYRAINDDYDNCCFKKYKNAAIIVERTLLNGCARIGLVCAVNLEQYGYEVADGLCIKSSENIIKNRIMPRIIIRENSKVEFSHTLLLFNDINSLINNEYLNIKNQEPLYDFSLKNDGGHIRGWLVKDGSLITKINTFCTTHKNPNIVVGDGNHSIYCAKHLWNLEKTKDVINKELKYFLAEIVDVNSISINIKPIHRLLTFESLNLKELFEESINNKSLISKNCLDYSDSNKAIDVYIFIDNMLKEFEALYGDFRIDYIHDVEGLDLCDNQLFIKMPTISKSELFTYVSNQGNLPNKSFSVGTSNDKRYYLEGRKI